MAEEKRSFLDRMLSSIQPGLVEGYRPQPQQLAEGLWAIERKLKMPGGFTLPVRTTVVRLQSGALVVLSPPKLDADFKGWLRQQGEVAAVMASNVFHYLFVSEYPPVFPSARIFVAPGLPRRVPALVTATELENAPPELWAAEIQQAVFGPVGNFSEVVFFHRPTETLILTDLAFNLTTFDSLLERVAWRLFGVPSRFGPSRTARLTLLRDKRAAGEYLRPVREWPFRRIVVSHGIVLENNAQAEFRRAFAKYLGATS
ncbi:MAG: DUF4336 domain-containing protein [Candidatus Binatia bacterium]